MKSQAFGVDLEDRVQLMVAFPRLLIMAGEASVKAGDALIFGPFGLNVAKYNVLMTLVRAGGQLSMTSLKDRSRMMRSPSNFTQLVDDLETRKLVRRVNAPQDRRVSLVEITADGTALLEQVNKRYYQVMQEYTQDFPTNEMRDSVYASIKWIWRIAEAAGIAHLRPTEEPFQE